MAAEVAVVGVVVDGAAVDGAAVVAAVRGGCGMQVSADRDPGLETVQRYLTGANNLQAVLKELSPCLGDSFFVCLAAWPERSCALIHES